MPTCVFTKCKNHSQKRDKSDGISYFHVLAASLVVLVAGQRDFPPGFKFGAATASYQIEGGWNASDKGVSIWDHFVHTQPDRISDRSNGDVACDSYHLWREDVQLLADMGVDFYRFSISWPRILPSGFPNYISEDGSQYYSNLIDELLAHGIEPVVTLYHWDLPQYLQDLGGWTNPLTPDWFADYARVVYSLYGDRVKIWLTVNEPIAVCESGYGGTLAPGFYDYQIGTLLCSKYILLAHAKAYRIYEEEFKPKYNGEVSFAQQEFWFEPATPEDAELTSLAKDHAFGRFAHPIFSESGGWPPALEQFMAEKSKIEGYPRSRLPAFTPEEIQLLKGSADFFALNHYTSRTVRPAAEGESSGAFLTDGIEDLKVVLEGRPDWPSATSDWFLVNPVGLRHNLKQIKEQYGDWKIMITENGYSDNGATLDDQKRVEYYRDYLEQLLLAITEDKINVFGYTAWSLMDNFEWMDGYQSRFGLHAVDFSDPRRPRTPRASARYYTRVIAARSLDVATSI